MKPSTLRKDAIAFRRRQRRRQLKAGLKLSGLLDELEELGNRQSECRGHALDVDQAEVPCASLDVREIGPVDARPLGELLLSQAQRLAPVLDRAAETFANVRPGAFSHCVQVRAVSTMSVSTMSDKTVDRLPLPPPQKGFRDYLGRLPGRRGVVA